MPPEFAALYKSLVNQKVFFPPEDRYLLTDALNVSRVLYGGVMAEGTPIISQSGIVAIVPPAGMPSGPPATPSDYAEVDASVREVKEIRENITKTVMSTPRDESRHYLTRLTHLYGDLHRHDQLPCDRRTSQALEQRPKSNQSSDCSSCPPRGGVS